MRAHLVSSLAMAGTLILVTGFGFSRGVLVMDFVLAATLMMASRSSLRILDRVARRWRTDGRPAVVVAGERDALFLLEELEERREHGLRPVAIAERRGRRGLTGFRGYPLFHGSDALERAIASREAEVVVTVRRGGAWPRGAGDLESECDRLGVVLAVVDIHMSGPPIPAPASTPGRPHPEPATP